MPHVGIDLGTTYSCVMHQNPDGSVDLIRSADGGELTPSVVYFDPDGSVQVGASAKQLLGLDPDNVIVGIKRHMGTDHPLELHGTAYTPEAISALILKRLATDAAAHFGVGVGDLRCVITVPAYFGVAEKEATFAAARIAGLTCLELLAEPAAAAYAYGGDSADEACSLVFDLGGGTFDVAVVANTGGRPQVWAVDGETQLGGLDWDRRLRDLIWQRLVDQGTDEDAIYDDDFAAGLDTQVETVKRSLSSHESGQVRLRYAGAPLGTSVTRTMFEEATSDLVGQCVGTARRLIDTAHALGASPASRILLVGGSTRMPMISDALTRQLGLPTLIHDPDKAVARGAAVLAARLSESSADADESAGLMAGGTSRSGRAPTGLIRRIQSVLSRAIGIKVYSSRLPLRDEPYVLNLIPANTPLPVRGKRFTVATIQDNQETARIELLEQSGSVLSEELDANRPMFDAEISGIRLGKAGSPINLVLSVDVDGRIDVQAADGKSSQPLRIEAFIHGVIDEGELADQATKVSGLLMQA